MALVRDHALRRREGLASNSLVMMQSPVAVEPASPLVCPTRGCRETFHPDDQQGLDFHIVTAHPRSRHADATREHYRPRHEEEAV